MKLSYRMSRIEDRPELVKLWATQTGWGEVDQEVWEHRFVHTPFGEAAIALAVDKDSDELAGQLIFIPMRGMANGREITVYRLFAAFVNQTARSFQALNPFKNPMLKMYEMAIENFRKQEIDLIYALPNPLLRRMFQMLPNFQTGLFPLYSLNLPLKNEFQISEKYSAKDIKITDERIDALWEKSLKFFECSIARTTKALTWKTSHFKYIHLGLEQNGEFAGFCDLVFKRSDRQWMICDVMAVNDDAFRATIAAACNRINLFKSENPGEDVDKIAILTTNLLEPFVKDLGFYRDDYDFLFVAHNLNSNFSSQEIAPARWQVSAND